MYTLAGEERSTSALKGKVTEEAIADLVTGEKLPPTVPFNDKNSPKIFGAGAQGRLGRERMSAASVEAVRWVHGRTGFRRPACRPPL